MHAISSYRGNRPTNTHIHRQDRLQYTAPQLARSVMNCDVHKFSAVNCWHKTCTFHAIMWDNSTMLPTKPKLKKETKLSLTNRATHLCKRNGVADLLKRPSPYWLPCWSWSFCVKGCIVGINTEPENWGALELRSLGMGGVADSIHAPSRHVLPRQIC